MIERLDYRDRASTLFKRGTDPGQKAERMIDAGRFLPNRIRGPLCSLASPVGFEKILERCERAHDHMIGHGEGLEILKIIRAQPGNEVTSSAGIAVDGCGASPGSRIRRSFRTQ